MKSNLSSTAKSNLSVYLTRAKELEQREPIMNYFCTYYAARMAIESQPKAKESQAFLVSLLDYLENLKKDLASHEAITNELVGYAYVENFALKIFNKADDEDRSGLASQKTAKTFHAASLFLEVS